MDQPISISSITQDSYVMFMARQVKWNLYINFLGNTWKMFLHVILDAAKRLVKPYSNACEHYRWSICRMVPTCDTPILIARFVTIRSYPRCSCFYSPPFHATSGQATGSIKTYHVISWKNDLVVGPLDTSLDHAVVMPLYEIPSFQRCGSPRDDRELFWSHPISA